MTSSVRSSFAALGWLTLSVCAHAAGGHFDVDDAAIAEPGHCQYELWWSRAPGAQTASSSLFHLGPACRLGPVELGLTYDRLAAANDFQNSLGPQLKWVVDPLAGPLSAGVAWSATFELRHGGRPSQTLYVPLTWAVSDKLAINANLGIDRDFVGTRTRRFGVSGEWIAHQRFTVIGERVRLAGEWTSRIGMRFMLDESTSLDLSAARVGPQSARVYVIGVNRDFSR